MSDMTPEKAQALLDGATPGPWGYDPDLRVIYLDDGAVEAQIVALRFAGDDADEAFFTATLLAAAPDLARAYIAQAAELARLRAREYKLAALLNRAREELYMIRMKDSGAVYDVTLRMELADALSAYEEAKE